MSYQLSADNKIITRIADGARFPVPSEDYPPSPDQQTYMDWIALGNAPLPPSAEEIAAELEAWRESLECSPVQGEETLAAHGLLAQVEAMIEHPDTPETMRRAFRRATVWRRTSPSMLAMIAALGLTDEQADAMFVEAREVVV